MAQIIIDVWQGDWGLPSIESQSLAVLSYCKLSGIPIKINYVKNLWKTPCGDLPVLRHGKENVSGMRNIFAYLSKEGMGADINLTANERADIVAFTSMIEEKLVPTMMYLWWLDVKTYTEVCRPWYGQALQFPYTMYYPTVKYQQVKRYIEVVKGGHDIDSTLLEAKLYREARECLNCLSAMLADNEFFFPSSMSSLDAIVFGHITPLLKVPYSSSILLNHLKGCTNLCTLSHQILSQHFPLSQKEIEAQHQRADEERTRQTESVEYPHRIRNMALSGVVATAAMVVYAFWSGIINIEWTDNDAAAENKTAEGALRVEDFMQFQYTQPPPTGDGEHSQE